MIRLKSIPRIKLIHGDCLEIMPLLSDKSVDLIFSDLPYGVTKNTWDIPLPFDVMWKEFKRLIKDNGAIILFADGMFLADLMTSNRSMWRYNLVWDRVLTSGFLNANRMPLRQHEELCIFYKKPPVYNPQMTEGVASHSKGKMTKNKNSNYGDFTLIDNSDRHGNLKYPTSIIRCPKPHMSKIVHPTQKPVELCEWVIKTYTNENDLVIDPCTGSGTTGVACKNINRRFIGIEKNSDTYKIANSRITEV